MKLINERTRIAEVADAWAAQYRGHRNDEYSAIGKRLKRLDLTTATASDVANIVGNDSWTRVPECDECGAIVPAVVEIGEEPDYESSTTRLCLHCLRTACALLAPQEKRDSMAPARSQGEAHD